MDRKRQLSPRKSPKRSPNKKQKLSPKKSPGKEKKYAGTSPRGTFPSGTNGNIKMQRASSPSPRKSMPTTKSKGSPKKNSPLKKMQKNQQMSIKEIADSIVRYGQDHNPYLKTSEMKKSKAPLETSARSGVSSVAPYVPRGKKHDPIVYRYLPEAVAQVLSNLEKIVAKEKDPSFLAVVFDIDSTVLRVIDDPKTGESYATREGIMDVSRLYKFAIQNKMRIFFITARPDYDITPKLSNVQLTKQQLAAMGFKKYDGLILMADETPHTYEAISGFKRDARALALNPQNSLYTRNNSKPPKRIVLTVGDNYGDLLVPLEVHDPSKKRLDPFTPEYDFYELMEKYTDEDIILFDHAEKGVDMALKLPLTD